MKGWMFLIMETLAAFKYFRATKTEVVARTGPKREPAAIFKKAKVEGIFNLPEGRTRKEKRIKSV